ncbi:MAG: SIS domain-containing protein [Methylophaga sp.]|nr:SIS domain-containing protein [Methylophaga sp.]
MSESDNQQHLKELYPFLHNKTKDPEQDRVGLLESIKQKAAESIAIKQQFFEVHSQALLDAAQAIANVYKNKGRMYAMGNGGSSCDAAHFCVEFQHPVTAGRPALAAMNLLADTAMNSAVSNDVGYQHIFVRQLDAHAREYDGLMGFSTSGCSANLMTAYAKAKEMGLVTLGFAGGDGGEMKTSGLVDHCLVVESDSIHRIQETHVACYHIIWDLVHTLLADSRGQLS